jgi:peroxiredoxin Q/BCP
MSLEIGSLAPNFDLPGDVSGHLGQIFKLSDYQGKRVVLYFYPKDDTSGCTAEACSFRDDLRAFRDANAVVFGISRDSLRSHEKFREKYGLTFPLLSDEQGEVCMAYGVWAEKSMYGKKYFGIERSTFLIDEAGIIRHIWRKVKVEGHSQDVLKKLQEI